MWFLPLIWVIMSKLDSEINDLIFLNIVFSYLNILTKWLREGLRQRSNHPQILIEAHLHIFKFIYFINTNLLQNILVRSKNFYNFLIQLLMHRIILHYKLYEICVWHIRCKSPSIIKINHLLCNLFVFISKCFIIDNYWKNIIFSLLSLLSSFWDHLQKMVPDIIKSFLVHSIKLVDSKG